MLKRKMYLHFLKMNLISEINYYYGCIKINILFIIIIITMTMKN